MLQTVVVNTLSLGVRVDGVLCCIVWRNCQHSSLYKVNERPDPPPFLTTSSEPSHVCCTCAAAVVNYSVRGIEGRTIPPQNYLVISDAPDDCW